LARAPLLRVCLARLSAESHVVPFSLHHIVSDAWSMTILVRELTALYAAFIAGEPSPLPEVAVQYPDFAAWQRQWMTEEMLAEQVEHWRRRLAGAPPLLELPADRPRPDVPSFRGGRVARLLTPGLEAELRAVSRREGVTEFMAVLTVFQVLLYHYTGGTDIVIGTDIAGRNRVEIEQTVGFFANQLPLRADLSGGPAFRDALARVREATLEAYARQDLPYDWLIEALRPVRNLSYSPLVQVKLTFQHLPAPEPVVSRLAVTPFDLGRETAQLDMIVNVSVTPQALGVAVEYSRDLFDETRMRRLIDDLEALLAAALARPETSIDELAAALSAADRHRRLDAQEERRQARLGKLGALRRKPAAPSEGMLLVQRTEDV
jgi:hypothetical protein